MITRLQKLEKRRQEANSLQLQGRGAEAIVAYRELVKDLWPKPRKRKLDGDS